MPGKISVTLLIVLFSVAPVISQVIETVTLPEPQRSGGMPLFEALDNRQTLRDYTDRELDIQTISNLLWAAFGINREDGKRTAPTARDWREFDIYVVTAGGWYVYDAEKHALLKKSNQDRREYAGRQDFVHTAPLTLIFVADYDRMPGASDEVRDFYAATDVGFISQNVYLFCASEGLGTCVLGQVDRDKMREVFRLRPGQRVVLSQTMGYPQ
ncbi:MAG: SagB/ThcOx family dehydrogenase [Marinilabiliales bacterium]|nr:MAG: SagB/ThcOx family dehydrogenase [Marinilabiliales bacterium]